MPARRLSTRGKSVSSLPLACVNSLMFPTVVAAFILTTMLSRLTLQHASTTSFIVTALTCPFLVAQSFNDALSLTLVRVKHTTQYTMQKEKRFTISQMQLNKRLEKLETPLAPEIVQQRI